MKLCLLSYSLPPVDAEPMPSRLGSWAACCLSEASSSQKRQTKRSVPAEGDYLELKSWLICG